MRLPHRLATLAALVTSLSMSSLARAHETNGDDQVPNEWNSPALAVTGIVLAGTGSLTTTIGSFVARAADERCVVGPRRTVCEEGDGAVAGPVLVAAGATLLLAGIPMIVAGAWQVPSRERRVPPTTAELRVGAARGELVVTF
jgi:hypothetical protein